jgi:hypothetical protein
MEVIISCYHFVTNLGLELYANHCELVNALIKKKKVIKKAD